MCGRRLLPLVMVALLLAGCGENGVQMRSGNEGATAVDPVAVARKVAAESGEKDPTDIVWVESRRSAAVRLISGSEAASKEEDVPVMLVQMSGSFTSRASGPKVDGGEPSAPSASNPASVDTLSVVVDSRTGDVPSR